MKKNGILRLAVISLVVTICTLSLVSGSLAKYFTSTSGGDSVRVAKFGVTITADGDLFTTNEGSEYFYSVFSSEDNVFAPGTTGSMTFNYSGTPEVAVELSFDVIEAQSGYSAGWKESDEIDALDYFPLLFTVTLQEVGGTDEVVCEDVSYESFVSVLNTFFKAYEAGTDIGNYSLVISWEWPFEGNDEADTYLGDLLVAPTFELAIKASVTHLTHLFYNKFF